MTRPILLAAGLAASSALGLIVVVSAGAFLPAQEFAKFSVFWSAGQLIASLCFEWLRLTTVRHWQEGDVAELDGRRNAIRFFWTVWVFGGFAVALGLLLSGEEIMRLVAASVVFAVCSSTFDIRQSIARSTYDDVGFFSTSIARSAIGALATASSAFASMDAFYTLLALSLSYVASVLIIDVRFPAFISLRPPSGTEVQSLLRYGGPLSIATILTSATLFVAKAWAASFAAGSNLLLLFELSQRLMIGVGVAANLVVLPQAVRTASSGVKGANDLAIRWQVAGCAAIIIPIWLGLTLGADQYLPLIGQSVSSEDIAVYRWLLAGFALVAIRLYITDAIFTIVSRTTTAPVAAGVALLAVGAAAVSGAFSFEGAFVAVNVLGALTSFLASAWLTRRLVPWTVPVGSVLTTAFYSLCCGAAYLSATHLLGIFGGVVSAVTLAAAYIILRLRVLLHRGHA